MNPNITSVCRPGNTSWNRQLSLFTAGYLRAFNKNLGAWLERRPTTAFSIAQCGNSFEKNVPDGEGLLHGTH